jgi:hypothetical protein
MRYLKLFENYDKNISKLDISLVDRDSTPVENYKGVLQYICSDVNRSIKLTKYLKNELTQIFGKHNSRFRGEFLYYVWIVEFDGEVFQIFTNSNKGTGFSIIGDGQEKSSVCIDFLKKMEELLDQL